jgi:agmatinase
MLSRKEIIQSVDPNGVGISNGKFAALPFDEEHAQIVVMTAPCDITTSFAPGTAYGPQAVLDASPQLDLIDTDVQDAWKFGLFVQPVDKDLQSKNEAMRVLASKHIAKLESGESLEGLHLSQELKAVNNYCNELHNNIEKEANRLLNAGKLVGLLGGDHSSPLGLLRALAKRHDEFGLLTLDAHLDLRKAYEGFTFSHASIFYNALELRNVRKFVHLGIRDFCEEEIQVLEDSDGRIQMLTAQSIEENMLAGKTFHQLIEPQIAALPEKVYVSIDIDGLDPSLCPNTGTPVPGGFSFFQAVYVLKLLIKSGRKIIGFDVCEVGNDTWDANVGARMLYKLANLAGESMLLER